MAINSKGQWIGFGVGDVDPVNAARTAPNWEAVSLINEKLYDRFNSVRIKGLDRVNAAFTELTAECVEMIAKNYGMTVPHDVAGHAVADLAFRKKIGAYPPPPPPRHAMLTVRGTGGVVDADPTSWIADWSVNHYEVPMLYAASMGGIPVAAAVDPMAPSGNECAVELYNMLVNWVSSTTKTFSIAAYSLGTKGVIRFLNDLCDPKHPLFKHLSRLVSVILIGDPWRPFGHSFYLGPIPSGQGIGTPYFTMSQQAIDTLGWRVCWLANPADMYTNSPLGGTGQVLADVEEIILATQISDPFGTLKKMVVQLMKILQHSGLDFPGLAGGFLTNVTTMNVAGIATMILPLLVGMLPGLMAGIGGNGQNLPAGPAADAQAAILALKFYGSGIRGHVSYGDTPWGFGPQTYIDLGIQHANDWGFATPVKV